VLPVEQPAKKQHQHRPLQQVLVVLRYADRVQQE